MVHVQFTDHGDQEGSGVSNQLQLIQEEMASTTKVTHPSQTPSSSIEGGPPPWQSIKRDQDMDLRQITVVAVTET